MTDFARLRPLIGTTSMDMDSMLEGILKRLDKVDIDGNMRITLLVETGPQKWDLDLKKKKCVPVKQEKKKKSVRDLDLELIMSEGTWTEIALGRLAPLEAFGAGKLRVRGDADLANKLYEHLKDDDGGVTRVCR